MYKGVQIENDKSIDKLAADVFSKLNTIANPEGTKQPIFLSSGLAHFSLEDALRELNELKNKPTS